MLRTLITTYLLNNNEIHKKEVKQQRRINSAIS